jgi:hypothetical protein
MATNPPSEEAELKARIADLTKRLAEAESALMNAAAGLRRYESLAQRNERLESLGARADAVAHDLNNVFAPILMAAALLKERVSDEKGQRMLTVLEENAQRGAALVRLVRDFGPGDDDSPLRKPPPPLPGGDKGHAGHGSGATIPPGGAAAAKPALRRMPREKGGEHDAGC